MTIIIVLSIIIALVIIIALLLPIIQVVTSSKKTEGTIIGIEKEKRKETNMTVDCPVFEFYVDGQRYEKKSYYGTEENKYKIGDKVSISYNKKNISNAFISNEKNTIYKSSIGTFLILFVAVILVCVIMFIKK